MATVPISQDAKREDSLLAEGEDYKVTKWREHDNFECTHCDYSTIFWFKMEEHYQLEDVHNHVWSAASKEQTKEEERASEFPRKLEY